MARDPKDPNEPPEDDGRPYEVGYGKAPKGTRYKPGQTGNPRGRPKGRRSPWEIMAKIEQSVVTVKGKDGRRRKMRKIEVVFETLMNNAMKGDAKAMGFWMQLRGVFSGSQPDDADEGDQPDLESLRAYFKRLDSSAASSTSIPKDKRKPKK